LLLGSVCFSSASSCFAWAASFSARESRAPNERELGSFLVVFAFKIVVKLMLSYLLQVFPQSH